MHSEFFYLGIEAGFKDEMQKQAILSAVRQGWNQLGERVADSTARAAANIYSQPLGQKATHAAIDAIQNQTRRAVMSPGLEGALTAGSGMNKLVNVADFAMPYLTKATTGAVKNAPEAARSLGTAASRGIDDVFGRALPTSNLANAPITRSGADILQRRQQRLAALGIG